MLENFLFTFWSSMNEPGYRIDARHRAWAWSVLVETFIRGSIMGMSTRNSGSVILNGEFQELYKECVFDCKWHKRFAARKVGEQVPFAIQIDSSPRVDSRERDILLADMRRKNGMMRLDSAAYSVSLD